jgi:hypothetical protein
MLNLIKNKLYSPCVKVESAFIDKVSGKMVYRYYLKNGKKFLANSRFNTFRVHLNE